MYRRAHNHTVEFGVPGKVFRVDKNALGGAVALKLRVVANHFDFKPVAATRRVGNRTARLAVVEIRRDGLFRHFRRDADMRSGGIILDFGQHQPVSAGQFGDLLHGVGRNVRHQV